MELLTVPQAAEYLSLSAVRVRQFCQAGRLGRKVGYRWIITMEELEAFAERERPIGYPLGQSRKEV